MLIAIDNKTYLPSRRTLQVAIIRWVTVNSAELGQYPCYDLEAISWRKHFVDLTKGPDILYTP